MNKVRAKQIVAKALRIRKLFLGVGAHIPICPYNLAEAMGFDVRFVNIPSFEGMYLSDEGMILIAAERPEGRKRFTCAHEIGHHVLGHGTIIDEIIDQGSDKDVEREADFFASVLIMPASAIKRCAAVIDLDFSSLEPEKIYILSRYLGVSYMAVLTQLYVNLKLLTASQYYELKKIQPKVIKDKLYSGHGGGEVFVVGCWWLDKSIDVVVGDKIISEDILTIEGQAVSICDSRAGRCVVVATEPGIAKVDNGKGWSSFVRVSRKAYAGMNQYRHEEEVK